MKHLKTFENITIESDGSPSTIKPNFEVNDNVICIYKDSNHLTYGKKYKIEEIFQDGNNNFLCKTIDDEEELQSYYASKFIREIDIELNKYNL